MFGNSNSLLESSNPSLAETMGARAQEWAQHLDYMKQNSAQNLLVRANQQANKVNMTDKQNADSLLTQQEEWSKQQMQNKMTTTKQHTQQLGQATA